MTESPLFSALRRLLGESLARRSPSAAPRLRRRELLSLGAGGAVLASCAAEEAPSASVPRPISEHVVVVGAGLAGLACAHRLRKNEVQAAVYEGGSRVGGRIYTGRDLFVGADPALLFELGAEFVKESDSTLRELAGKLEVGFDPLPENPAPQTPRVYWIAGRTVPEATLVAQLQGDVANAIYLAVQDADANPDVAKTLDDTSLGAWLEDNVPATMYPELSSMIACAFRAELGREPGELSAYNLRRLFPPGELQDAPSEFPLHFTERHDRVRDGCDRLPRALADEVERIGDPIEFESRLIALRGVDGHYVLTFETPNGGFKVEATHVVLAIPFSTLRKVDLSGVELPREKRALIAELGYGTSCKLVGAFERPVWSEFHGTSGDTLSDGVAQHVWDSTHRTSMSTMGDQRLLTSQQGGRAGESGTRDPDEDFLAVVAELDQVFPPPENAPTFFTTLIEDSAVRVHWPSLPLALGSNPCALPGQWRKLPIAGRREGNLHFCGDHCSIEHLGRMEGAVQSGINVADEILEDLEALTPPSPGLPGVDTGT